MQQKFPGPGTDKPVRYKCTDQRGERTLIVPTAAYNVHAGDPTPIVLDIEARTGTRLKDGGDPLRFLRIWQHFQERHDPAAKISFAAYCARRHSDQVDVMPTELPAGRSEPEDRVALDQAADGTMLSVSDLAKRAGVDREKLRRCLDRWRPTHDEGWYEITDRKPRDPRYLYDTQAVQCVIFDLLIRE